MQVTLSRAHLRAMLHLAAKSASRYSLNGVLVEIHAIEGFLVATTGTVMGAIHFALSETEQDPDRKPVHVIIPRDVVEHVAKGKSSHDYVTLEPVDLPREDGSAPGQWKATHAGTSTVFSRVDGKFPDWRRVMPQEVSGLACQVDPDLLSLFVKAGRELGMSAARKDCPLVGWNGAEPNDHGIVQGGGAVVEIPLAPEFIGVIMTRRTPVADIPKGTPAWARY